MNSTELSQPARPFNANQEILWEKYRKRAVTGKGMGRAAEVHGLWTRLRSGATLPRNN